MKPGVERTRNIIDFASIYDESEAIWWMRHEIFPFTARFRTIYFDRDQWNSWVERELNVIREKRSMKANSQKLTLSLSLCELKKDENVLISWNQAEMPKNQYTISSLTITYSNRISPNFHIGYIEEQIDILKLSEERKSQVYMVVQRHGGLDLQDFEIDIPKMDIEMNYGSEWAEKHEELMEVLAFKKKKGIALLHGLPGTGKSMYIRHLISTLSENKTVIYLPNQLISCITDPGFIPLMAEYSGSILVIEDADEAIKSRKNGGGTVDKLLNLADGILSDFLGMQIICTFNNDLSSIDDALLRKGRLILKHEFGKLKAEDAQKLSDTLGFKTVIEDDMTLAEIYNQDDKLSDVKKKESKIGFR
jgi:ATP-dependent 26S proteasome regulatory subunit